MRLITDSLMCGRSCGSLPSEVETKKSGHFFPPAKRGKITPSIGTMGVANIRNMVWEGFRFIATDKKQTVKHASKST